MLKKISFLKKDMPAIEMIISNMPIMAMFHFPLSSVNFPTNERAIINAIVQNPAMIPDSAVVLPISMQYKGKPVAII